MIPTPSTTHVDFARVYEPAEDSYLLLDTLSSTAQKLFLRSRFIDHQADGLAKTTSPLVIEVGTGSGVLLSFVNAHSEELIGRSDVLTAGVDVNPFACQATKKTIALEEAEQRLQKNSCGFYLGNLLADLTQPLILGQVDILLFNPPYVPTSELPSLPSGFDLPPTNEADAHLLSLSYAGGMNGRETILRLLATLPSILNRDRGCAYVLLSAPNNPEEIQNIIKDWGDGWLSKTVGDSGKQGGWESLQVVRIWRN